MPCWASLLLPVPAHPERVPPPRFGCCCGWVGPGAAEASASLAKQRNFTHTRVYDSDERAFVLWCGVSGVAQLVF